MTRQLRFTLCLLIFAFAACAQRESKPKTETTDKLGPKLQDTELDLTNLKKGVAAHLPAGGRSQVIPTARLFEAAENLMELGDRIGQRSLTSAGHKLIRSFYSDQRNYSSVAPADTLYLEAALGEKWTVLEDYLDKNERDLAKSLDAVETVIRATDLDLSDAPTLTVAIDAMLQYLVNVAGEFRANGAAATVVNSYMNQLNSVYVPIFQRLKPEFSELDAGLGIDEALSAVDRVIGEFGKVLPGKAPKVDLKAARKLSKKILEIDDAEKALDVLIDVWLMMTPEARRNSFYVQNPKLHDFLASLNEYELRELQQGPSVWRSPYLAYARANDILPGLKKYGIAKFKETLDLSGGKYVAGQMRLQIVEIGKGLPGIVGQVVLSELHANEQILKNARKDEKKFFTDMAVDWGGKQIFTDGGNLAAAERPETALRFSGGEFAAAPGPNTARLEKISTLTVTRAMRASVRRWRDYAEFEGVKFDNPEFFRSVLIQLNKILALGGFRDFRKNLFSSYHFSINGDARELLDLKELTSYDGRFGVPDSLSISRGLTIDRDETARDGMYFSAAAQASVLSASAEMAVYFRDWVNNGFDEKMGRFVLADVLPTLSPEVGALKMFPKDRLLELSLAVGCVVVKNLLGPNSQLVLVYPDGRRVSGKELSRLLGDLKSVATDGAPMMAAVVDVDSRKGPLSTVRTADTANFILAIASFLRALDGLEQSKSELINTESFKAEIKTSRFKLSMLMMTLANFLSGHMQDETGVFRSEYSFSTLKFEGSSLPDQAIAIRALLAASLQLKSDLYRWAALDGYYALNAKWWSSEAGFYSEKPGSRLGLDEYLELLLTLEHVSQNLDGWSRRQIESIKSAAVSPFVQ